MQGERKGLPALLHIGISKRWCLWGTWRITPNGAWAEEVGFEPTKACTLHDFQSCSLDHYETPPSGESGIRTHEGLHLTAFRERHFRPLRHLSAVSITYPSRYDKHYFPYLPPMIGTAISR